MQIILLSIGKTDDKRLAGLIDEYTKRLSHYVKFEMKSLPDIKRAKTLSQSQQKVLEGQLILDYFSKSDQVILLDESGKSFSSIAFANQLQKYMNAGFKRLIFVIGGPYGFSDEVYARANGKISLSEMTFSHQMVRLFAVEQLYRAFTILRNEPYHHN